MKLLLLATVVVCLGACAGRTPAPVAVVQSQDRYMDCGAINAEVQANTKRIAELGSEEGSKVAQNVAAGVVGIIIWPVWFGMDFQNAAGKEVAALQSRQQYLATLAEQRCGALPPVPIQTIPQPAASPSTPDTAPQSGPAQPPTSATPVPVAPAAAPASTNATQLIDCIDAAGSRIRVVGTSCPASWKPAQ
jgi:hypothetical protein